MTDEGCAIVLNDAIHIPFWHKTLDVDQWRVGTRGAVLLESALYCSFVAGSFPEHLKQWSDRDK